MRLTKRHFKYVLGIAGLAAVAHLGVALAAAVTQPMDIQLRTHIKIMQQNPQGKWIPFDEVRPTRATFQASLAELASSKNVTTNFVLRATTKKGKPYSARLVNKADLNFNPGNGKLEGKLTYEVEYDGKKALVPAVITTESRNTPAGAMRGVRANGILGNKPVNVTLVSANQMSAGGQKLLLVCKEEYKLIPKGK